MAGGYGDGPVETHPVIRDRFAGNDFEQAGAGEGAGLRVACFYGQQGAGMSNGFVDLAEGGGGGGDGRGHCGGGSGGGGGGGGGQVILLLVVNDAVFHGEGGKGVTAGGPEDGVAEKGCIVRILQ